MPPEDPARTRHDGPEQWTLDAGRCSSGYVTEVTALRGQRAHHKQCCDSDRLVPSRILRYSRDMCPGTLMKVPARIRRHTLRRGRGHGSRRTGARFIGVESQSASSPHGVGRCGGRIPHVSRPVHPGRRRRGSAAGPGVHHQDGLALGLRVSLVGRRAHHSRHQRQHRRDPFAELGVQLVAQGRSRFVREEWRPLLGRCLPGLCRQRVRLGSQLHRLRGVLRTDRRHCPGGGSNRRLCGDGLLNATDRGADSRWQSGGHLG